MFSIIGVGFSSWVSGTINSKDDINVNVGEVNKFKYNDCAYFLINSEHFFDFTIIDGKYFFKESYLSLKFVIDIGKIKNTFYDDTFIKFKISYEINNTQKEELFIDNSIVKFDDNIIINYRLSDYYCDIAYEKVQENTITKYSLNSVVCLFSSIGNQNLYDFFNYYGNDKITLDLKVKYNIIDSNKLAEILQNCNFYFETSLEGKYQ